MGQRCATAWMLEGSREGCRQGMKLHVFSTSLAAGMPAPWLALAQGHAACTSAVSPPWGALKLPRSEAAYSPLQQAGCAAARVGRRALQAAHAHLRHGQALAPRGAACTAHGGSACP